MIIFVVILLIYIQLMVLIGSSYEKGTAFYDFDSYGVETAPKFLDKFVDLGSDEKMQLDSEHPLSLFCD